MTGTRSIGQLHVTRVIIWLVMGFCQGSSRLQIYVYLMYSEKCHFDEIFVTGLFWPLSARI